MQQSQHLFTTAQVVMPGGVNSPVRAFKAVGGVPRFIKQSKDCYVYDVDNNQYIDYVLSWGAVIAGHAHPKIVEAVQNQSALGLSYGMPTQIEITMAETLCQSVPNMEQVRMVNSGTEATMSALRLAFAATSRSKFIKFEGCYHGHADPFLVKMGSGALTMGVPTSLGVREQTAAETIVLPYNEVEPIVRFFEQSGDQIAAIIVEPVAGNMNCIPPSVEFLKTLRYLCDKHKSLLIFDEVMTGFRLHPQGAQGFYGVDADLITLGKIIGGGMPVGAFGGKKELMQMLSPVGGVYQAGTLSGNPVAMAAGLAQLEIMRDPCYYKQLEQRTKQLCCGMADIAKNYNIPFSYNQVGSMFGFFFSDVEKVENYRQALTCNIKRFNSFFAKMLDAGIYFAPSAYEAGFVSLRHEEKHIVKTLEVVEQVMKVL